MKTVIMAGGLGKRATNIASDIPKPLISIADKPILQWEIECLVRQGFTDILLTVSYMAEKIEDFFADGENFGCHINYFFEKQPLGNAGALFKLWETGELAGDFLLLNADLMFDVDFKRFVRFHQEHGGLATLFTHPNNHPYDSGLIISSEEGMVKQWLTKEDVRPKWYKNTVNAGVHILNTDLLEHSGINPADIDADYKVDLDRDILKPLVSTGRIFVYGSPEYIKDMGTSERFGQVLADLKSGKVSRRNLSKPQKAIFLDRDGTINRYVGFLRDIDEFELIKDVADAIRLINASGYLAIVCTNQPVIARGEVTVEQLETIHNKMETLLGNEGAYLDKIYYCPHHPDKGFEGEIESLKFDCDCRKPKPGMLLQAANDFNIDLEHSWMIGDGERDIRAGKNAGCKTVLISSADGNRNGGDKDYGQDMTVKSLKKAVEMIVGANRILNPV